MIVNLELTGKIEKAILQVKEEYGHRTNASTIRFIIGDYIKKQTEEDKNGLP